MEADGVRIVPTIQKPKKEINETENEKPKNTQSLKTKA
jgi:hypothetical protein